MEEQINQNVDLGEDLNIDIKKFFFAFGSRKNVMIKVFTITLLFFISLTFFMKKMWIVSADLYVNKSNSSNYSEVNPFALEELGISLVSNNDPLADEVELIKSPLVLEKVIQENNLKYKKLFGIITTKKTGKYISVSSFLKSKKLNFESKKGTSILAISYECKNKELAYNVVSSIIKNYIELHKEINSEKSKSDKKIIETEYHKAKVDLNKKVNSANGLPTASLSGTGNLAAMSAFSRSAQSAMANLKGQYVANEKSRVEISEEASKVSQLASKLEWAKMVEEMSGSSKVLVIKEPTIPHDWEYASPNLMINILVGIIVGTILAFILFLYKEFTDEKLTYSCLNNDIIYNLEKEFKQFCAYLITNKNKRVLFAFCCDIPVGLSEKFKIFNNISIVQAGISESFSAAIQNSDQVVLFAQIGKTNSEDYKIVKNMIKDNNRQIMYEVLI